MRVALATVMHSAGLHRLCGRCIGAIRRAAAQWPDRPLRMIVPLPAGSAVDMIARLIAQQLSARLGQPVIVENRAGASGVIGADAVAKAAPDGYTLGMATSTTHMTAPVLNAKLPYDPVKDFAPVAVVGIVALRAGGQSQGAGQECRRADCARQSQAEDAELFLGRQRQPGASRRRVVRRDGRRRAQSHSVQDLDPCGDRSERGPHRHAVRHPRHQPRAHPRGQAPRARGHHRKARSKSCPMCRP